jgi:hypothetical protein
MTDGFFQKIDYFGNTITAFKSEYTSIFLDEYLTNQTGSYNEDNIDYYHKSSKNKTATYDDKTDPSFTSNQGEQDMVIATQSSSEKNLPEKYAYYLNALKTQVIPNVEKFFDNEKKNWNGIECYKEMIADNYKNKFQPEWPGFYLEYEFEKFINDNQLNHVFNYYQDKTKGGIDLDLYFPQLDSYGDLKSHSISSNGIPGNDWDTVMSIIDEDAINSHIYYIICVSEAEKDSLYEYEVTHFWNTQQKKDNLMSYSSKMKNNVTLKKIYILDINKKNKNYLTIFRQGINSNGKPRAPKIMIDEKNLEHFIIFEKNLS